MPRIYFYKMTEDNGGAPHVTSDLLSLAICKPFIRKTAENGDIIFGFAANALDSAKGLPPSNRLIYIAEVTEKLYEGKYYKDKQYSGRGDCIYVFRDGAYQWKPGALHHGPDDLEHDLGSKDGYSRANVLLSNDFRYFGRLGTDEYKNDFAHIASAVENLGIGHRVNHGDELKAQLKALKDRVWESNQEKMKIGEPTNRPTRDVCHRSTSCGVV
jgi:hypothetical protein